MNNIGIKPNVMIKTDESVNLYKNNVVQSGLDWILDKISNLTSLSLTHIAVGDNATPVSLGDSKLWNELYRKSITDSYRDEGTLSLEGFFDTNEANFTWQEIGLFAGGTGTKDSGTLVARAVVYEYKDALRTATITWDIGLQNV